MDPILSLAGQRDIAVIEDAAQALGATYVSPGAVRQCGSMGLCGCFSFFPSKNLGGVGDGGIIVTNDESFAEKLRMLRNHGAKPKYYHSVVGGNFRLDPIQAAVLLVKLPQLNAWHEARRRNAARYDAALGDTTFVTPVAVQGRVHHIYNQYTIRVEGRRDELKTFLGERGVSTEIYYPLAFHEQECFRYLGYRPGDFPNCERAARAALSLPVYPGLSEAQQDYVVENLKRFHG
jgi:dTDP-4-amino-4,6-dideoxygalactose transaminase